MHCGTYPSNLSSKVSIYFLRTTPGTVNLPNNFEEAHEVLPQYFDFGILNSHPLFLLSQMLTKVYNPLLSYRGDLDEPLLPRLALKQKGEEQETTTDKVDDEKLARVIS